MTTDLQTRWRKSSHYFGALLLLAVFSVCLYSVAHADGGTVSASDAVKHVGTTVTVCGLVASAKYATGSRGRPTFLNLDQPYPNQIFTAVIWGSDRSSFQYAPESLDGQRVAAGLRIVARAAAHWEAG